MTVTVRTWSNGGPYYADSFYKYEASSLKDLISHVRMAMEDHEQYIGIFHDDECIGLWEDETEPEPDGEGGWDWLKGYYVQRRPGGSPHWDRMVRCLKQA